MPIISTKGSVAAGAYGFTTKNKSLVTQSFTSVGNTNWTVPNGVGNVEVLVVGGGGPGGSGFDRTGGAGGGGGVTYNASYAVTPGSSIPITVGAGGVVTGLAAPSAGGDSIFGSITSNGGGYGGASASPLRFLNVAGSVYNRQLTNVSFTNSGTTVTATIPGQLTYSGVTFTYDSNTKMVTGTVASGHALLFGNQITVSGTTATTNAPNGTWIVNNVISSTQFTFHISNGLEPTGSIGSGTVQTASAHGLVQGQKFTISGTTATTNPPNNVATNYSTNVVGTYWTVASVVSTTQFTFVVTSAPTGTIGNGTIGLETCTFMTSYTKAPAVAAAHNYKIGNYFNIIGTPVAGLANIDCRTNQSFFTNVQFSHTQLYGCTFTNSGTTITVTTPSNHGFLQGDPFTVYNTTATTNPPNEASTVDSVISPTQFTFTATSAPTGTIGAGDVMGSIITCITSTPHGITLEGGFASSINVLGTTSAQNPLTYQLLVYTVPNSTTFTFKAPIAPYNPRFTGSTFSYSGTTITVTTPSNHGLAANSTVNISGVTATTNAPNGTFYIASIPAANQFTYIATTTPTGTLSTGTVIEYIGNTSTITQNIYTPSYQYYFRIPWQIVTVPTASSYTATVSPAPTGIITGASGTMGLPPSNGASAGAGGHNQSGKNGTITTGIVGQGKPSGDGYDTSFGIFTAGGGGGAGSAGGDGNDYSGGNAGAGLTYFGTMYGSGGAGSVQTLMSAGTFFGVTVSSATFSGSTITINTATAHGLSNGDIVRCSNFSMQNVVISSATFVGSTITVNTATAHGLTTGDTIYPYAFTATTNPPNGTYTVASTPSTTQFTYVASSVPTGTLASGQLLMSGKNHPMGNFTIANSASTSFTFNNNGLTPIGAGITPGQMYGRTTSANIPTFTYNGTKITVTCTTALSLQYVGQSIRVHGVNATTNAPNGSFRVSRIINSTTFQYVVTNAPTGTLTGGFWETPATFVHYGANQESSTGALTAGTQSSGGGLGAASFPLDGSTTYFNGGNGTNGTGGGGGAPAYQYPDSNAISPIGGQGGSGVVIVRYYDWA